VGYAAGFDRSLAKSGEDRNALAASVNTFKRKATGLMESQPRIDPNTPSDSRSSRQAPPAGLNAETQGPESRAMTTSSPAALRDTVPRESQSERLTNFTAPSIPAPAAGRLGRISSQSTNARSSHSLVARASDSPSGPWQWQSSQNR
jgi:hypothetical protein